MASENDGSARARWYRVVERTTEDGDPFWHIRLRPEDRAGRDLVLLVFRGCEEHWTVGTLHNIAP